jgi:hypothetical protein
MENPVVRELHLERANASRIDGHHVLVLRMPLPEDHDGNPIPSQAPLPPSPFQPKPAARAAHLRRRTAISSQHDLLIASPAAGRDLAAAIEGEPG